MRTLVALLFLSLAAPAFADYEAGFGYQVAPSYRSHRHHSHRYYRPRREVTTITRDGNRTRIEKRRYYSGSTARVKTSSGAWARAR